MFGAYWFGYWIYPLAYIGLTQLLWIDRIRKHSALRFLLAIVILFVISLEKIVILVTSLHRDFVPGKREFILSALAYASLHWFVKLMCFSFIVFLAELAKRKFFQERGAD